MNHITQEQIKTIASTAKANTRWTAAMSTSQGYRQNRSSLHRLLPLGARASGNRWLHGGNIVELDATYLTCFHQIHSAHISNVISTCVWDVSTNNIYPGVHKCPLNVSELCTSGHMVNTSLVLTCMMITLTMSELYGDFIKRSLWVQIRNILETFEGTFELPESGYISDMCWDYIWNMSRMYSVETGQVSCI